jgi:hypothetical protein
VGAFTAGRRFALTYGYENQAFQAGSLSKTQVKNITNQQI